MISHRATAVLAVLAGLAVLVAGCATPIAGTAQPAEPVEDPSGGLPLRPGQQQLAAVFAEVRTWDMCAMHDIDAAARATGYEADELLPYRDLGICRLVMKEPGGVSQWELELDVYPVNPADDGSSIRVGDRTLEQVGDADDTGCAYSLPIGPDDEPWGIELSVYSVRANRPPCDVARDYATALGPRMTDPPLRREHHTSPALDLAASNPCALVGAMVPILADGQELAPDSVEVEALEPFACGVAASTDSGRVRASVAFTIESDEEFGSSTVAGFPAVANERGSWCEILFAPSDVAISGNPGMPTSLPVVGVTGSCRQIDQLAEAAAGALAPAPAGTPRENAVALGDLDPPPTAAAAGSPFDPCADVTWADYPPHVQPESSKDPVPLPVRSDDPFAVGCKFNSRGMISHLVWGMPTGGFTADPAVRGSGSSAAQFGGRPGVEEVSVNASSGEPNCYSAVQLTEGIAAMSTTLTGDDPCAVNRAVLEQLAQRVS